MTRLIFLALPALLSACSAKQEHPHQVGLANPASVYCQKVGGSPEIVKEPAGEVGYCTLPSGERIDEWALYRRDNPSQ
ncbi:hemolysin [bacteria symbiont BFo1 of Frankliniella occidentalis]|uniref:putative hemolysin n=1 Tax=Erwinia aphidicola TaxID=68334 RepID=UPI0007A7D13B|nr:DUF333 domain-containing protein [Erwinia aphidicola]KYP85537.1 hemolysin [bacteria symbiont BFo1 of Frankliniella occidentalis]KYP90832.1 hemolysin [bacteria symbiont BFo1 of Frankliniella occidentalis]